MIKIIKMEFHESYNGFDHTLDLEIKASMEELEKVEKAILKALGEE